jgi:hypothetical protein
MGDPRARVIPFIRGTQNWVMESVPMARLSIFMNRSKIGVTDPLPL